MLLQQVGVVLADLSRLVDLTRRDRRCGTQIVDDREPRECVSELGSCVISTCADGSRNGND